MKIILKRNDVTDHGIFGHLNIDGLSFNCVTLERHDIAIAPGTYPITIYDSPKHGNIPLLSNVPGRSMIEIHEGNWEFQSKGCILVGASRGMIEGKEGISGSRDTLKQLVSLLSQSPDAVSIEIS